MIIDMKHFHDTTIWKQVKHTPTQLVKINPKVC